MKKWIVITVLLVCVATFFVCAGNTHPSESVIKKEFYLQNPNTEIIKISLIFDEVAVATYKIEFKKTISNEISETTFTLHQCINWDWKNDYRECAKN